MHNNLIYSLLLSIIGFILSTVTQASTPAWTLSPVVGYPTTVTINSTETAIVKYIVTNQSRRAHTLQMKAISAGISATGCEAALTYQQSCILTLLVSGGALKGDIIGGPVLCSTGNPNECYQPSATNWLVVNRLSPNSPLLSTSVTTQALTINCQPFSLCPTLPNRALTGHARQFTIVNKGYAATNVRVNTNRIPAGTVVSSPNCDHIAGYGGTCVITVTPGAVASSDASGVSCTNGTIPIPGTITMVADGGVSTQVNIYVLSHGCQYQGGFIYAVDDTTPNSGSIGGKVAALTDQAEPYINIGEQSSSIIWSTNGGVGINPANVSYDKIPGIDEQSVSSAGLPTYSDFANYFMFIYTNSVLPPSPFFKQCDGNADGLCNTNNIVVFYNTWQTNDEITCDPTLGGSGKCTPTFAATSLTNYSAGLCKRSMNGFSDWYLPSICEMDAVTSSYPLTCPAGTQSILENLSFLIGDPGTSLPSKSCDPPSGTMCLAGVYWSSTEESVRPEAVVWYESFESGSNAKYHTDKFRRLGVRCVRAF